MAWTKAVMKTAQPWTLTLYENKQKQVIKLKRRQAGLALANSLYGLQIRRMETCRSVACLVGVLVFANVFSYILCSQVPLAPRYVLTHYGLQGITAKNGILLFLTKPPRVAPAEYVLALYLRRSNVAQRTTDPTGDISRCCGDRTMS